MKKHTPSSALVAAIITLNATSTANEIRLQWDPPDVEPAAITNYTIWAAQFPLTDLNYTKAPFKFDVGTNLTTSIAILAPGKWHFTATSQSSGLTSDISNVIYINNPGKPLNFGRENGR